MILALLLSLFAHATPPPSCKLMQDSLYAKPVIEIRMIFGYKDARPARFVGDRHERATFVDEILAPCRGDEMACGFVRDESDADVFTKPVLINGNLKTARLIVVNSSVATDDNENMSDPFQRWKSAHAQSVFLDGLKDADVVFYNGHSRFGGGPDFRSPTLAKDGSVDAPSYKRRSSGLKKMITAFDESRSSKAAPFARLKILGLFSCDSSQHFNAKIRRVSAAGLISSPQLMYYSDALTQSRSALDDILTGRCPRNVIFN
jgi:hypothetical protein